MGAKPGDVPGGGDAEPSKGDSTSVRDTSPAAMPKAVRDTGRATSPDRPGSVRRMTVLAVDDSPAFVALLSVALQAHGVDVVAITDPALVFSAVFDARPDVVLLDVEMPGFDGPRVARLLRGLPHTRDLPIVMCSASLDLAKIADDCGATAHIDKTQPVTQLVRKLLEMLGRQGDRT